MLVLYSHLRPLRHSYIVSSIALFGEFIRMFQYAYLIHMLRL